MAATICRGLRSAGDGLNGSAVECSTCRFDERGGDFVGDPGGRDKRGHAELRVEVKGHPGPGVGVQQPHGRELLVGWMVRHPCQRHGSRRLDGDREKQLELLGQRPAGDMDHHPHAARLTLGVMLEDLDVSDDVRAPLGVAIDRGEQGKARLERCGHVGCGVSVKWSCTQRAIA